MQTTHLTPSPPRHQWPAACHRSARPGRFIDLALEDNGTVSVWLRTYVHRCVRVGVCVGAVDDRALRVALVRGGVRARVGRLESGKLVIEWRGIHD